MSAATLIELVEELEARAFTLAHDAADNMESAQHALALLELARQLGGVANYPAPHRHFAGIDFVRRAEAVLRQ